MPSTFLLLRQTVIFAFALQAWSATAAVIVPQNTSAAQPIPAEVSAAVSASKTISTSAASERRLIAITSSVPSIDPVSALLVPKAFLPQVGSTFAKLGFHFGEPMRGVQSIELESCAVDFRDGVEFFISPGLRRLYGEGGSNLIKVALPNDVQEFRSLALNLLHNEEVCLKSLIFKDAAGQPMLVKTDNLPLTLPITEKIRDAFKDFGLGGVVDHELLPKAEEDPWNFRLRGDGTFLIFGMGDEHKSSGRFSALGTYSIEESGKGHLRLKLKGERFSTPGLWDGWYCGVGCAERISNDGLPVNDSVMIERASNGGFMIRNRTEARVRTLPFSDLHVHSSHP